MAVTLNPINAGKINTRNPVKDFPFEFSTMALNIVVKILCIALVDAILIEHANSSFNSSDFKNKKDLKVQVDTEESDLNDVFNGAYSECLIHLSYTCLQRKTLLYLHELNGLREISVIGDYVKFVKLNNSEDKEHIKEAEETGKKTSEELSNLIDKAVDNFFNNHLIRFSALGKDVVVPQTVEEFVGRKRKGGGGGGGHGGGDGDGGKKKMMMMAMMCMKMKLMMMLPAMMGMMGMMSFKGMMFSMMTFMISKMMLLMKLLEKKGGGGGGGGGGGDGSWAGSGGGGAWMPAGSQDYGGGGGYDSNAQWSSRSILEKKDKHKINVKPVITYINPIVRYNNPNDIKPFVPMKNINDEKITNKLTRKKRDLSAEEMNAKPIERYDNVNYMKSFALTSDENLKVNNNDNESKFRKSDSLINSKQDTQVEPVLNNANEILFSMLKKLNGENIKVKHFDKPKRKKRGLIDALQNAYIYWTNTVLGLNNFKHKRNHPKYKIINGVKYMYYPLRHIQKVKTPKELPINNLKTTDDTKPIIITDFNKGEIVEARMNRRKMQKMNENVNETVDENPWE